MQNILFIGHAHPQFLNQHYPQESFIKLTLRQCLPVLPMSQENPAKQTLKHILSWLEVFSEHLHWNCCHKVFKLPCHLKLPALVTMQLLHEAAFQQRYKFI